VLAGSLPELPVLLANRSTQLMKLAARLQFQPCRNVLVTDIGWPPYHDLLAAEAVRTGRALTVAPVRDLAMQGQATDEEILDLVRTHYVRERCDGLFLTAVSHLGVRLPVEKLVRSLEAASPPRFVVIDGAQEFCHVSADLRNDTATCTWRAATSGCRRTTRWGWPSTAPAVAIHHRDGAP